MHLHTCSMYMYTVCMDAMYSVFILSLSVSVGTFRNLTSAGKMSPHRTRTMKDQEAVSVCVYVMGGQSVCRWVVVGVNRV